MKSTSIVFSKPRQVNLIEEKIPEPGKNEFTIQTLVTLLSIGTELTCYRGESDLGTHWHGWVKYPFYPGYSCVGRIIKIGDKVTDLEIGDRIYCSVSHRQFANLSAEYNKNIVKLPDDISDEEGAWCTLAAITQTGVRQAEHSMGDTAVVIGLGPLGQLIVQYLQVLGLREILAIDLIQPRLDRALKHGATQTFCGNVSKAIDFVLENTDGMLADVVYDVTGNYNVFPKSLKLAKQFGKIILQGDSPHPSKQHITHDLLTRQLRVIGSHNQNLPPKHSYWTTKRQIELFINYIQRKKMQVHDLITHRFTPNKAEIVYRNLENYRGDSAGIIFDWRN